MVTLNGGYVVGWWKCVSHGVGSFWFEVPREMHGIGHSESQSRYWYCLFVWLDVQYIHNAFVPNTTYQPETIFCFWQLFGRKDVGKAAVRWMCNGSPPRLRPGASVRPSGCICCHRPYNGAGSNGMAKTGRSYLHAQVLEKTVIHYTEYM